MWLCLIFLGEHSPHIPYDPHHLLEFPTFSNGISFFGGQPHPFKGRRQVNPSRTAPERLGIVVRCIEGLFERMEQQSLQSDPAGTI
jgi:hypothetical protein